MELFSKSGIRSNDLVSDRTRFQSPGRSIPYDKGKSLRPFDCRQPRLYQNGKIDTTRTLWEPDWQ